MAEHLADEELSIGNYVLSGGELAAAVIIDAVARLLPGVLGNETSAVFESFQDDGPRRRAAGLPAVHPAGGVSRLEGAGSAAERQPRGDPAVAAEGGAGKNARACARTCSGRDGEL